LRIFAVAGDPDDGIIFPFVFPSGIAMKTHAISVTLGSIMIFPFSTMNAQLALGVFSV
jgi:hypothetical protein